MSNNKRKRFIAQLRKKRITYREIGELLGISWQRVHQINTGYHSRRKTISPINHRILTQEKLQLNGFNNPNNENPNRNGVKGGREYIREWVRIRDKHTCQICFKKWKRGERRFDVHHIDESLEGRSGLRGICKSDRENMDKMITLCHKCHLNLDSVKNKMSKEKNKTRAKAR